MPRLDIRVCEARNLKNNETFGIADPYCKLRCEQREHTTKCIKNNLSPRWDEAFDFTLAKALTDRTAAHVDIVCWNKNRIQSDTVLGMCRVPIGGLRRGQVTDRWYVLSAPNTSEAALRSVDHGFNIVTAVQQHPHPPTAAAGSDYSPPTSAAAAVGVGGGRPTPYGELRVRLCAVDFDGFDIVNGTANGQQQQGLLSSAVAGASDAFLRPADGYGYSAQQQQDAAAAAGGGVKPSGGGPTPVRNHPMPGQTQQQPYYTNNPSQRLAQPALRFPSPPPEQQPFSNGNYAAAAVRPEYGGGSYQNNMASANSYGANGFYQPHQQPPFMVSQPAQPPMAYQQAPPPLPFQQNGMQQQFPPPPPPQEGYYNAVLNGGGGGGGQSWQPPYPPQGLPPSSFPLAPPL